MENVKTVQSLYTKTPPNAPCYSEYLPQKTASKNGTAVWCSLYYQFSYNISDTEMVTIGERDRHVAGIINAVRKFWNDTDIEIMLKMSESDIAEKFKKIAEAYNTDTIIITTDEEQIHFECMDEKGILF